MDITLVGYDMGGESVYTDGIDTWNTGEPLDASEFLQLETRDGPRYIEALHGARRMREHAFSTSWRGSYHPNDAWPIEREYGIPFGTNALWPGLWNQDGLYSD